MTFFQLIGVSLGSLVIILFLREVNAEYALYASVCASIIITYAALDYIAPVISYAQSFIGESDLSGYASVIMRVTAIGIITRTACDICTDAGEKAICTRVELIGKGAIALTVLPIIKQVLLAAKDFLT